MADYPGRRPSLETVDESPGAPKPSVELQQREERHVRLSVNTTLGPSAAADSRHLSRSDAEQQHTEHNFSPTLRRRTTRATFKNVEDYDELDPFSARPGWEPGAEPGYDPLLPDGGHASLPTLYADCEITVVDFSKNQMVKRHFVNDTFIDFLEEPQSDWAQCRWINVNGLSWDVIQALGEKKGLHKLALEDIMNVRNRTKTDW
jgi:Mg2+ and Co2+ transporter CorA